MAMREPLLEDFGLSMTDIAPLERWLRFFEQGFVYFGRLAGMVLGFAIGAGNARRGESEILVGFFCAGLGFLVATMFTAKLAKPLAERVCRFDPQFRRYEDFHAARDAFEAWQLRTRSDFWLSLTGHAFERELAALFRRVGYDAQVTPGSGDHGVDIVLKQEGLTTVVQCKLHKSPVGPAAARELLGSLVAWKADAAILAAPGGVTPGVHGVFRGKPLRVMGLKEILELQERFDDGVLSR
jgi:hypothetical protein